MPSAVPDVLVPLLEAGPVPQPAFAWPRSSWAGWTGGIDGAGPLVSALPERIDRQVVVDVVRRDRDAATANAFIAVMIWGYGYAGYGPYRTVRVLSGAPHPEGRPASVPVLERLREGARLAADEGAVAGFRYLNNAPGKIPNLGSSYFTKWLFFASLAQPGASEVAPILDVRVRNWLASRTGITLALGQTEDYGRFIGLLRDWGEPYGWQPHEVEEAIFELV